MAPTPFEVSSLFVRSLADGVRGVGQWDQVRAGVGPETRAALERPDERRWHPGVIPLQVCTALQDAAAIEQAFALQTERSLGPVVTPLLKVALAIAGNSPAVAFGRLNDLFPIIMRGLSAKYEPGSPTAGVVTLTYPETVSLDRFAGYGWAGALKYAFHLCGVEGSTRCTASMGRIIKIEATWRA